MWDGAGAAISYFSPKTVKSEMTEITKKDTGSAMPENMLRKIKIFEDLDDGSLNKIQGLMKKYSFSAGEMLFKDGDPGEEMFVISKGAVSIFIHDSTGNEIVLTDLKEGTCFGEMSIIDKENRSASCRIIEDTDLLALHADDYMKVIDSMPESATKIMNRMVSTIVERIMRTGAFVAQMAQYGEESRKRAITDPATGLFNRRYLEESLEGLVTKAITERSSISLAMFDLDRFGSLNSEYGQQFCDELIVKCSEVFRNVFSKEDILIRYGGDEFIFIFPEAGAAESQKKCDDLCEAVRSMKFTEHEELKLTCSLGFASIPETACSLAELKEKSDQALYEAKEAGRDRAVGAKK